MNKKLLVGIMMLVASTKALAGNGQIGSVGNPSSTVVEQQYQGPCRTATAQPFLNWVLQQKIQRIGKSLAEKKGIHIVKVIQRPGSTTAKILRVRDTEVQARQSGSLQLVSDEGVVFDVSWSGQYLNPEGKYEGGFDYVNAMMMYFEQTNSHDSSGRITGSSCSLVDKTDGFRITNHKTGYQLEDVTF
jgi:hypothetical protein